MPLHQKVIEELDKYIKNGGEDTGRIAVLDNNKSLMQIDFGDPKGGNIIFRDTFVATDILRKGVDEMDFTLKTNLYYSFKEAENGEIDLELKKIYNFNTYRVSQFDKDTIILITDPELRRIVQTYMKYQKVDSVVLLKKGQSSFVLPTPNELMGKIGDKDLSNMNTSEQKRHEKDDLKVYETPSNILETVLRSASYCAYTEYIKSEIGSRVYAIISSSKKTKQKVLSFIGTTQDMEMSIFCQDAVDYLNYATLKSYRHPVKNSVFEDESKISEYTSATKKKYEAFHEMIFDESENGLQDKRVIGIFEYIDRVAKESKETKNPLATMLKDKEAYKKAIGRELKTENIVFFDPQAGSAAEFFKAGDKIGLGENLKMWGTEFRDNIDYGENAHRAKIIGGVNTALMAETMSNVFFAKKNDTASKSMITWNNPPYSLDDGIAKASLDMYKNDTMILGLYPTKMKNYLKNTLDGGNSIIVEVPRSLTGYEDPNTPERFLVVAGKKYTVEAEAKEDGSVTAGVFGHNTNGSITEASLPDNATQEDLLIVLNRHFMSGKNILGAKIVKNMDYFESRDWVQENILYNSINESVEKMKKFYQNAEKFNEIIQNENTKKLFEQSIQPLQIAKTEKVFLDTRYYSKSGDYKAMDFNEVISNVPLLIHYTKTKPKIMDIIEIIAKEKDIKLPLDRSTVNTETFIVGEKYNGEKVKVATDKLGMMKFNFYPTDFNVTDEKSRKNLIEVIKSIYKDNGRDLSVHETDALDLAMKSSHVLTTKTEMTTSVNTEIEEYLVLSQECLVLEGDDHSIKLNINTFDLYNKLEEMGYFDINDYIELVELGTEKKRQIIDGFVDYIQNVTLKDIAKYLDRDPSELFADMEQMKKELQDKGMAQSEIVGIVNDAFDLRGYVETYFERTKKMTIERNIEPILEKYFGQDFGTHDKEGRKKMKNFIGKMEDLYRQNEEGFFGATLTILLDKLKGAISAKYEQEGRSDKEIRELHTRMADAEEDIRLSLTELEKFVKETATMAKRLGTTLYYTYANLKKRVEVAKDAEAKGVSKEQIDAVYKDGYDKVFRNWERKVASLMEHQITEPENFTELEEARTNFMLKKMRTGKTLTFIFSGLLEMMTKKSDMEMYLNAANISDIASQLTQHIPILLPSIMVYAHQSKHQFVDEVSFNTLYHTSAVINPLPIQGLSKQLIGGGSAQAYLANRFSKDIELIERTLEDKYPNGVTLDDMLRDYENSDFIGMIKKIKGMCSEA